ncbi:MAG: GTP-dependent dephospho-CoA kinase family protein [Thermoplasmatales archaeon]|nr:GTP-dependent dephospho-CoA kinase family protein [Candidatus Thermoplasmatota archaeon]MDA8054518.1 GTP-dependent dephospho-CoA kinase family protein [Thermoplasmatales archaeon]
MPEVLITKESQIEFLSAKILITVGDVVTATALRYKIVPKLSVVDFKTKRDEILPAMPNKWDRTIKVRNHPGSISVELWNAIDFAFKSKGSTLVEVDGEEDLASIPAILMAPDGAIVIYGVPDKGIAVYEVGDHLRQMVNQDVEKIRGA